MRKVAETSLEAYRSLDPNKLTEIYKQILFALSQIGEGTYEDVSVFLKIEKSRVWKRISELLKAGLIYRPGNKKALSSGRAGFTYRLADTEMANVQASEKVLSGLSISDFSRNIKAIANAVPYTQLNLL